MPKQNNTLPPEDEHIEYKNYCLTFQKGNKKKTIYQNIPFKCCEDLKDRFTKLKEKYGYKADFIKSRLPNELKKEICALLNNNIQNGIKTSFIKFGIDDNSRKVSKIYKYICKEISLDTLYSYIQNVISKWSKSCFLPSASPYITIHKNSNNIIYIQINSPKDKIFWVKYPKKDWNIYTRTGSDSSRPMPENLYDIIKKVTLRKYEAQPILYDQQPCNHKGLKFYYLKNSTSEDNFHKILNSLRINSHKYFKAAFFFSNENTTKVNIFHNNTKTTFGGPINKQIKKIMKYIKKFYGEYFSLNAIRELLFNAYAHRSYYNYEQEDIEIHISKYRIMISSPGILPGNLTIDSLYRGSSFLRNPLIYHVLKILQSKKYGNGFNIIKKSYKSLNHKPFIWSDFKRNRFNIILPNIHDSKEPTHDLPEEKEYENNTKIRNKLDEIGYNVKKTNIHHQKANISEIKRKSRKLNKINSKINKLKKQRGKH